MVSIVIAAAASIIAILLLVLSLAADRSTVMNIVISKAWSQEFQKEDIVEKAEDLKRRAEKYQDISEKSCNSKLREMGKKVAAFDKTKERYMSGKKFGIGELITAAGYKLLRLFKIDAENESFRKLVKQCESSGYKALDRREKTGDRRNSHIYAEFLIANTIGYVLIGIMLALIAFIVLDYLKVDFLIMLIVVLMSGVIVSIVGYSTMDSMRVKADKRQAAIDYDFPNVISEMALLVTAGMNIINATEQAALSGDGIVYREIQTAVNEFHQSSTIAQAFSELGSRMNNRYLDKTVALIISSSSAGNRNLAQDLREINDECWTEKRQQARKLSATIQSKLTVPTMIMFLGILIVIILPVLANMNL